MHVDSTRLNPDWRIVSFASDVPACCACFGEELILRNNFEGFESGLVMQEGQKCIFLSQLRRQETDGRLRRLLPLVSNSNHVVRRVVSLEREDRVTAPEAAEVSI